MSEIVPRKIILRKKHKITVWGSINPSLKGSKGIWGRGKMIQSYKLTKNHYFLIFKSLTPPLLQTH